MRGVKHNANGHRRRQLVARVKAEETHCALCGGLVDQSLTQIHGPNCDRQHSDNRRGCAPHPMGPVVDEDLPRSRGGSPLDRSNVALMHRDCNQRKGKRTLAEMRALEKAETVPTRKALKPTNLVKW